MGTLDDSIFFLEQLRLWGLTVFDRKALKKYKPILDALENKGLIEVVREYKTGAIGYRPRATAGYRPKVKDPLTYRM